MAPHCPLLLVGVVDQQHLESTMLAKTDLIGSDTKEFIKSVSVHIVDIFTADTQSGTNVPLKFLKTAKRSEDGGFCFFAGVPLT